jgi:hypothetical protein
MSLVILLCGSAVNRRRAANSRGGVQLEKEFKDEVSVADVEVRKEGDRDSNDCEAFDCGYGTQRLSLAIRTETVTHARSQVTSLLSAGGRGSKLS